MSFACIFIALAFLVLSLAVRTDTSAQERLKVEHWHSALPCDYKTVKHGFHYKTANQQRKENSMLPSLMLNSSRKFRAKNASKVHALKAGTKQSTQKASYLEFNTYEDKGKRWKINWSNLSKNENHDIYRKEKREHQKGPKCAGSSGNIVITAEGKPKSIFS